MKVIIVNKSDSTGGAAVVSFRLMEALREFGVDARMLVVEKLTDSPYVELISSPFKIKSAFLLDRLPIAMANGFKRATLFKLDATAAGIDISKHPLVKDADIICLNWINQGVLSLKDIRRLADMGKRIVWTMHDMWNFTGACHHAGICTRFIYCGEPGCLNAGECGCCSILGSKGGANDITHKTWLRKRGLYNVVGIEFVAVSSWLAQMARRSTLLKDANISVIPNAFPMPEWREPERRTGRIEGLHLIMGAARLDDDIKGFPILIEATRALRRKYPKLASRAKLTLFGNIKNPDLLDKIEVGCNYVGKVNGMDRISELYRAADIVVSTSRYETLPGTLIEGQAYGCWPVSFSRGGQLDIIEPGVTGSIAQWSDNEAEAGENIADSIAEAAKIIATNPEETARILYDSVEQKFSAGSVAGKYLQLFEKIAK